MGLLNLAEIFSKSKYTLANPANPANREAQISKISEISRGVSEKSKNERLADFAKLVDCLASHEGISIEPGDALAMLDPVDLQVVGDRVTTTTTRRVIASKIVEKTMCQRGLLPTAWTTFAVCAQCGPVWLAEGEPTECPSCPWCGPVQAQRRIPRPVVECGECRHFTPDTINPPGGLGDCGNRTAAAPGLSWPFTTKQCPVWQPLEDL